MPMYRTIARYAKTTAAGIIGATRPRDAPASAIGRAARGAPRRLSCTPRDRRGQSGGTRRPADAHRARTRNPGAAHTAPAQEERRPWALYYDIMHVSPAGQSSAAGAPSAAASRETLDAWVREVVAWHFDPATGCPFWLDYAKKAGWDPRREIASFADLKRFGLFEDEWLRGGPVQRWIPKGLAGKPVFVFETGGTTGTPKTRVAMDDFRVDYEIFSGTLPDDSFPRGSNWLMLGPSGPRRLRLSVEHLAP